MNRKLVLGMALSAAAACSGDAFSFGEGSVRGLVLLGTYGQGQRLVEYGAPPLVERRSMPTLSGDSGLSVLLRDQARGGFYALRFDVSSFSHRWQLVRYDADWHLAAALPAAAIVDTVGLVAPPRLQFTPDHRYLVFVFHQLQNNGTIVVLDPVTLAVVNRTGRPPPMQVFPAGAPAAATGSRVLLTNFSGCPVSLVWLDVLSGLTVDSTTMPCGYSLHGALTSRRVYRVGPDTGSDWHLELYDIATGTVIATADSVRPSFPPLSFLPVSTPEGLAYIEPHDVVVFDAVTLATLGRVGTGIGLAAPRSILTAAMDDGTGALLGATYQALACVSPCAYPDGLIVLDLAKRTVAVDQIVSAPVQVVP